MKRRDFFKIIGGAAVAMVGVRAAKARVCMRDPRPFATPAEVSTVQTDVNTRATQTALNALVARVTAIETENARTTGTATAGPNVTINSQAIEKSGRVISVNIRTTLTSNLAVNGLLLTLPEGFRPSQNLYTILMRGQNTSADSANGIMQVNTDGRVVFVGDGRRQAQVFYTLSFAFVQ